MRPWCALVLVALAACEPAPPAQRYRLGGTVLAIDRGRGELVLQHGEIPGFMAAMTMPYPVTNAQELDSLEIGDQISADVVVHGFAARLEHIKVMWRDKPSQPGGPVRVS